MLSALGYHEFNPEHLTKVEANLEKVEKWLDDLSKELPIFSIQWSTPQTVESKDAINLLGEVRQDLLKLSGKVKKVLLREQLADSPDDIRFLISSLGYHGYSKEHLLRGILEFAHQRQDQNLFNQFAPAQAEVIRGLEGVHVLYTIFTEESEPKPIFYKSLAEEAALLPGAFRSYAHEALLFQTSYKPDFSFADTDIPSADVPAWQAVPLSAHLAGFWHAYHITAAHASEWIKTGISQPQEAWFWSHLGFTSPLEAIAWRSKGFTPPAAREAKSQGKTPDEMVSEILKAAEEAEQQDRERRKIERGVQKEEEPGNS